MRTTANSTRNAATKSPSNQQRKSFSNNLVILVGNLGAANDGATSFRMATQSRLGEKNTSVGIPHSLSGNWLEQFRR